MAKFLRRGRTRCGFVLTIASATKAPTAAELGTAVWLEDEIAEVTGFTFKSTSIDVPTLGSKITAKIAGPDEMEDSKLKIWEDDTANPLRTTLAKGTIGFIVFASNGEITSSSKVDVFPIEVSGTPRSYDIGNTAASYDIEMTVNDVPAIDVAVLT